MLGEQLADGLGELGTIGGPVVDAIALEVDGGWLGAGVVGAYDFDGAAVAGAVFFNHNNAVVGLLAGAYARQTDHQHRGSSSQITLQSVSGCCLVVESLHGDRHRGRTELTEQFSIADF